MYASDVKYTLIKLGIEIHLHNTSHRQLQMLHDNMNMYMRISENHNSLGCEQPSRPSCSCTCIRATLDVHVHVHVYMAVFIIQLFDWQVGASQRSCTTGTYNCTMYMYTMYMYMYIYGWVSIPLIYVPYKCATTLQ